MKQVMEDQNPEGPKQKPSNQQAPFSVKVWLFKKLLEYINGTFQALFTAAILGGALWIVQHLWGLRLLPFNVLDTILLVVLTAFVLLVLIGVVLLLGLRWTLVKYPGFFVLLGLAALVPLLMNKYPKIFSGTFQATSTPSDSASGQPQQKDPPKSA